MAEGDIDPAVIKRTQDSLGKYIKKPPLTEKLLKKPPFRFLHDVFNVVIKDTGYFEGLYTLEELTFENIKDRDDKMKFLQKMVDVIKIITKKTLAARTSKIVAGQEPEHTNELLQLMGQVIEKQLDWKNAVMKVVSGNTPEDQTSKQKTQEKPKENKTKVQDKEKTKEKEKGPKDKVTKAKEAKRADPKGTTKTISPSTKDEKSRKTPTTKEKEKVTAKSTKDKVVKEKEKVVTRKTKEAAEKPKLAKTKTESKDKGKSPSPIKPEIKDKSLSPAKPEAKDEKKTTVEVRKIDENQSKPLAKKGSPKLQSPDKTNEAIQEPKIERRQSKQAEDIQQPPSSLTSQELPKEVETVKEAPESRKSSAQRKGSGSSGKSRRTSANKKQRDENETPQQSINNLESLSAVNEEEPQMKDLISAKAPLEPSKSQNYNNEVKRENTFTRDNSRDSTGGTGSSTNIIANRPRTSLRPPSARPASARPGAPRRRDKNVEIVLQPNDQMKMSGINVKLESFGDFDDDGENLVIIENAENITGMNEESHSGTNVDENLEQGHLVQQILETQKELVQGDVLGKNEKEGDLKGPSLNGRQSSARQMNNLRDVIQNLTKSVNPFGKLMDFIPEDIDGMQLEMTMWRDSYTQAANELKREKSLTESATEPMKNQLVQIEANIKEYLDMIDASRTKVLQNSEKILKMLTEQ